MKKIIAFFGCLLCASVYADNIITSKDYVDTAAGNLQEQIGANDANTVLTYTATAGTVGEKAIYDSSATYDAQTDSLVTAGAFNTAIQNALETEFVCIEWLGDVHDNNHCLLYQIRATTPKQILPSGYTQLEYLESTGTQYLNLGRPIGSDKNIMVKFEYTVEQRGVWFGARDGDTFSAGFVFDYELYPNSLLILSHNVAKDAYYSGFSASVTFMTPYILNWHGNPFLAPSLSPNRIFYKRNDIDESNYLITPSYNAFLFAYNRGGVVSGKKPMRIYYFKVEGKMNLIPAQRDSDGELGMYDTVSNTFFTNAGAGEFVAGPVVSSNLYLPSGD